MAVNIQKNLSRAKVFDGNDVLALGDITVLARNDTDAVVAANASATDSLYGVGVAVAVNTVAHENIAYLGTGRVSGASLTVAAEIYEKEDAQALEKAYEDLVSFLARNGAMGDLIDLIRKSDYESSAAHQLDELLKKTNWTDEERGRIATYVDELTDRALWKEGDEATLRERVDGLILATWEAAMPAHPLRAITPMPWRTTCARRCVPTMRTRRARRISLWRPLRAAHRRANRRHHAYRAEQAHKQHMIDLACDLAEGKTLSREEQAALNEYLGMEADAENIEAIREMIVDEAVAQMTGEESALSSASVYPAALETLLNDQFAALANPMAWEDILYTYVTGGSWDPDPTLVMGVERTYTALIELLGARFGSGGELDGVGHRISTQAISGVGASSVGVAGAVAITVADARSEATVAAQNNAIDLTGDAAIRADEAQKVYTTASGSADKVLGNIAKMRTVNNPGTSVGVGASFALNLLTADVRATLGAGRDLTAASLDVFARLRNDVDTISVAGSDPIARRDKAMQAVPTLGNAGNAAALKAQAEAANAGTNTKGISADASVALAIVESNVQALVDAGATVKTTNEEDTIETLREGAEGAKRANVAVQAMQSGDSYAEGKAFSAGSRAAVGATVAVSLMSSDVLSALRADTTAAGSVRVYALTKNADEVNAVATSIGASIDRVLEKFRLGLNYVSPGAGPSNLSAKIATALSEKGTPLVGKSTANLKKASESIPLSNNILRVFNVDLDAATQRATAPASSASAAANAESGGAAKPQDVAMNSGTLNIAAAIGVAYNNHAALAEITGKVVSGGDVEAHAENRANFRTRASGATATSASIANVVGTAAAITVNRNSAEAEVAGSVEAAGNLDVSALTTQNVDGNYIAYLGAQAVAPTVAASPGGTLNIAGAVAVLSAQAQAVARIAENAVIEAKNVAVTARDQSKLGVRALGVSAGGGQTVGFGASFAILYAGNTVQALVGDGATITADSLKVVARREHIDESQYRFPFDVSDLFTVGATEDRDKGLFNLTIDNDISNVTDLKFETTISTDSILDVLDMLNYLAMVDYYVEAVSGTVQAGAFSQAALAGTVALLLTENDVRADVGKNAALTLVENEDAESLRVEADSASSARVIAGSISGSSAKAGVGATVAVAERRDSVRAGVGEASAVTATGDVAIQAAAQNDIWAVTTADAVATGAGGAAIGGGVNVILTGTSAQATLGDRASVDTDGAFALTAQNDAKLTLISRTWAWERARPWPRAAPSPCS